MKCCSKSKKLQQSVHCADLRAKFRYELKVASLEKIIRSKKALGRPRDLAVIEILEKTLDEKKKKR